MRLAVVDASVALAWYLPDEQHFPEAVRLLEAFYTGRTALIAPALWEYEVISGVARAARRGRLTAEEGIATCRRLLSLGIEIIRSEPDLEATWRLTQTPNITAYDACYLALAEREHAVCYSIDRPLIEAAHETNLVRWVGDFE